MTRRECGYHIPKDVTVKNRQARKRAEKEMRLSLISGAREGLILVWLVHCARCVFDIRCKRRRDTGMAGSLCEVCLWYQVQEKEGYWYGWFIV